MGLAILSVVLLSSCKKNNLSSTQEPVVQAYLLPGNPITVNVYAQKSLTDTANYGPAITGLKLSVSNGTSSVALTETSPGVYTYASTTFLVTGQTYKLSFVYNSITVSATTVMPARAQGFATQHINVDYAPGTTPGTSYADTLNTFTWLNPDSLNHVLVFDNTDGKDFPLNAYFAGNASFQVNTNRKSVYYALPQIFQYYGDYNVVLLTVNKEYVDLLQSNAEGANSQSLINTPTNVVNGFGIFTAMAADTLQFNLQ